MDSTAVFNIASLGWLSAQAVPLILWPQFVVSLLEVERLVPPASVYFARALGLAQLGLALQGLVLSGLLPLAPPASSNGNGPAAAATTAATAPYAWAAVLVATAYHSAAAFYSYGCYYDEPQVSVTAYAFGCFGSSLLAALGLWCLMFGDGSGHSGHISKRTGADKRTSGFPFKNSTADKRKGR